MIKSINYLEVGDVICPVDFPDNQAIIVRINYREVEIIWSDGSIGRIQEKDLLDFNATGKNYLNELKMFLGLIK